MAYGSSQSLLRSDNGFSFWGEGWNAECGLSPLSQVRRSFWCSVVDAAMMQKAKEESALLTVSKYTKALKVRTLWRTMVVCVVEAERARSRHTQQLCERLTQELQEAKERARNTWEAQNTATLAAARAAEAEEEELLSAGFRAVCNAMKEFESAIGSDGLVSAAVRVQHALSRV